ncbi:hypothetical protein FRAAL0446 [Frankia alni ACN14a]|uniref:Uncharacterized protein n=1 Tax=Frankia alni (strain DSM 45986 / CECT 9034 / ACN14a) TaxID=326424 RepID=Q0RTH7_FRAAA|nr:hypothetical protein FRAAL0446 [Frankia alni ACN14a]
MHARAEVTIRSSPPARGSSGRVRGSDPRRRVVPARAGIFLIAAPIVVTLDRRPRPRGDLPRTISDAIGAVLSSPPARGSSPALGAAPDAVPVVPARAGIFPSCPSPPTRRSGRPRPRGDLPQAARKKTRRRQSSPPARGSSSRGGGPANDFRVVPARAGIFLPELRTGGGVRGRPRPRGDLPARPGLRGWFALSSPPARGSSPTLGRPDGLELVVPARAGIFPDSVYH